MKVLVCGGREYQQFLRLQRVLDDLRAELSIDCLVHGAARGADTLAENWARSRQIKYIGVPAEWDRLKLGAGVIRNKRMLDEERPNIIVAFPGGNGTTNMIEQARAAGFIEQAREDEIVVLVRG